MRKWKMVTLGDVCDVERGGSPRPIDAFITEDEKGINWIKIGDTSEDSMYITKTKQKIIPEGMKKSRYVQPGDFLLSNSMSFGRPYILKIDGCIHDGWLVLRDKNNYFHKEYLYYALSSKATYEKFKSLAVGGVVNNLNSNIVKQVKFPLPPIETQKQIAKTLDTAAELLALRKQQYAELDNLTKSKFYDMFGDPDNNPYGWDAILLGETAEIVSGITKGRKLREEVSIKPIPYMRVANVQDGHLDLTDIKQIEVIDSEIEKYRLISGDLLMTEGGDPDKLGRCAIWNGEIPICIHQNHIFRVRLNQERIFPKYASFLIGSYYGKKYFLKAAKQTTGIATINLKQLSNFPVLIPDIDLQFKFTQIIKKSEEQKALIKKAIDETQHLFDSLMSRYFD